MAGNALIGALTVALGADTAAFETGLKSANKSLQGFGKFAGGAMKAAGLAIAAGAAAGAATMVNFGFAALNSADDIGDAANRIGVAASEFQKLQIAGVAAGGSTELMTTAMDKLNQNLGKAKEGSKGMQEVFKTLGLDAKNFETADQAFYAIAGGMEKIQDPATKAKLSMELFGKAAGVDMIEVLAAGEQGLKGYGDAAANSGRIMSDEMVSKLSDAKLALDNAKTAAAQMATVFTGQAVIAIVDFAKELKPAWEQAQKVGKQIYDYLKPSIDALSTAFTSFVNSEGGKMLAVVLGKIAEISGKVLVFALKSTIDYITQSINRISALANGISGAITWVKNFGNAFITLGRNITDGLVKGFADAGSIALQAVRNLGANIINAFKAVLGIHSPSREFQQLGMWTVDGLILGLEGKDSDLLASAERLAYIAHNGYTEKLKQLASEGAALLDSLKTPDERAAEDFINKKSKLNELLNAKEPLISKQEYDKFSKILNDNFAESIRKSLGDQKDIATIDSGAISDALKAKTAWIDGYKDQSANLQQLLAGNISEAFKAAATGNWTDFLRSKLNRVLDDAFNQLANDLGSTIASIITGNKTSGGGGFLNTAFNAISSIFGGSKKFASGGTSAIKGGGGTDSRLFTAWVSPNEIIDIRRPDQQYAANQPQQLTIPIYIGNEKIDERIINLSAGVTGAGMSAQAQAQRSKSLYSTRGR